VDEAGDDMATPLVNIHHHDLRNGEEAAFGGRGWHQITTRASGASCFDAEGGHDCMLWEMPAGYGQPLFPPGFFFDAMVNDMRPATATPLRFYSEFAVRLSADEALRDVIHMTTSNALIRSPVDPHADPVSLHPMYPTFFPAVRLNRGASYAHWMVNTFPWDGEAVKVHVHAHREAEKRTFVWAGVPEDAGLNVGAHFQEEPWLPMAVDDLDGFIGSVKAGLNNSIPVVCETPPKPPAEYTGPPGEEYDWMHYHSYDDHLQCNRPWKFKKGEPFSVLCISSVPSDWRVSVMGQHCNVHMLGTPDGGRAEAVVDAIGTAYGSWYPPEIHQMTWPPDVVDSVHWPITWPPSKQAYAAEYHAPQAYYERYPLWQKAAKLYKELE